jgi:hypothetical protein
LRGCVVLPASSAILQKVPRRRKLHSPLFPIPERRSSQTGVPHLRLTNLEQAS